MSLSLHQKYSDRAARVAQFFVLWLLIAGAFFFAYGKFMGEHFFQIAEYWAVSYVSDSIVLVEQGQRFHAGDLFAWAVQNWPETFSKVRFLFAYSIPAGFLFSSGIFWFFSRKSKDKSKHKRVRGARILSAKELGKELKKRT